LLEMSGFLRYVIDKFQNEGWSLDACEGRALKSGKFKRKVIVCTKTLYNYVDFGLLLINKIYLPEKSEEELQTYKNANAKEFSAGASINVLRKILCVRNSVTGTSTA